MPNQPNILLIILDSIRARNTTIHGHARNTTPFLNKLKDKSTTYTQARSPSIHSIASHTSMFTGLHVEEHQAIHHSSEIKSRCSIWNELSSEYEYPTGLFTNNPVVSKASNLSEPFDTVSKINPLKRSTKIFEDAYCPTDNKEIDSRWGHVQQSLLSESRLKSLSNCVWAQIVHLEEQMCEREASKEISGEHIVSEFLEWQRGQNNKWAACINIMDAHTPYLPNDQYNQWATPDLRESHAENPHLDCLSNGEYWGKIEELERLYDGSILQADSIVKNLVDSLKKQGEFENTLLIITSDHGEGFGEKSNLNSDVRMLRHKWGIHEVMTHVPLIVKYPYQQKPESVSSVASLTKIPEVFRSVINGRENCDPFTSDNYVISSTYRLLSEDKDEFENVNDIDSFVGPWRAVYTNEDSAVRKYATRKSSESVVINVKNAQKQQIVPDSSTEIVDELFDKMREKNVLESKEKTNLSNDLESHLESLGYIR